MRTIEAVIFDMDGVLVDTEVISIRFWKNLLIILDMILLKKYSYLCLEKMKME